MNYDEDQTWSSKIRMSPLEMEMLKWVLMHNKLTWSDADAWSRQDFCLPAIWCWVGSEECHFRDFSLRLDAEYVLRDQWVWTKMTKKMLNIQPKLTGKPNENWSLFVSSYEKKKIVFSTIHTTCKQEIITAFHAFGLNYFRISNLWQQMPLVM